MSIKVSIKIYMLNIFFKFYFKCSHGSYFVTEDGRGDADDVMYTEETENYIDPISKAELVDPVLSTKCKHRFSKRSIMEHLRGKTFAQ